MSAEWPTVLGLALAGAEVRGDQLDPALLAQPLIEAVAVVGTIADQSLGGVLEKARVDRLLDERDLMR
jgi:hypothetical protein